MLVRKLFHSMSSFYNCLFHNFHSNLTLLLYIKKTVEFSFRNLQLFCTFLFSKNWWKILTFFSVHTLDFNYPPLSIKLCSVINAKLRVGEIHYVEKYFVRIFENKMVSPIVSETMKTNITFLKLFFVNVWDFKI